MTGDIQNNKRENPLFMNGIFIQKSSKYQLRLSNLLTFAKVRGSKYVAQILLLCVLVVFEIKSQIEFKMLQQQNSFEINF